MPDIFDEVQEELRAERARRALQRYGGLLAGVVLLVVLGVGGWQGWRWWQAQQDQQASAAFFAADRLAGSPEQRPAAAAAFARLVTEGPAGYRLLSAFRAAGLKADAGDVDGASALWAGIAQDSAADPLYRDLATLMLVMHRLDRDDPRELAVRLAPLGRPGGAWRATALEMGALLDLRREAPEAARTKLRQLAEDPAAPEGARARAAALLVRLPPPRAGE